MPSRFGAAIEALEAAVRRSAAFRTWLRGRRWCGESVGMRSELTVQDSALLSESGTEALVFFLALAREGGSSTLLHLPLSIAASRLAPDAFELTLGPDRFYVVEAERRESFARFLVEGFRGGRKIPTRAGGALVLRGEPLGSFRALESPASGDSSNLLLRVATTQAALVFKSYKILDPQNREPAILERLLRREFRAAPQLLGELSLGQGEERVVLGVATRHINGVDLFAWLVRGWKDALASDPPMPEPFEAITLTLAVELGAATAALHDALMDRKPGPFQVEPFTPEDAASAYRLATRNLADSIRLLAPRGPPASAIPPEDAAASRGLLLDHRRDIEGVLAFLNASVGTVKSVIHADLHLGQVLRSDRDGALTFVDFEGEPERLPAARSVKLPPLRDVATMVRSFAYVRHNAVRDLGVSASPSSVARLRRWEEAAARAYRDQYLARTGLYPELEKETAERVILGWTMEKALYELRYELKHRPANYTIPLDGVLTLAGVRP